MTTAEIIAAVRGRAVKGVMFHSRMSEYFAFLSLPGYADMHRLHEAAENIALKEMTEAYISHTGELVPEEQHTPPETIPQSWYRIRRSGTDATWRKRAVRDGMTKWRDWETETAALLKPLYNDLVSQSELSLAEAVKSKIIGTEEEITQADRILYDLDSIDYSFADILARQTDLSKQYRHSLKKLFAE